MKNPDSDGSSLDSHRAGDLQGLASHLSASGDVSQAAEPTEIDSEALLGGRSEIRIRHRGEVYRLTLTRAGKLILHK